MKCPPIDLSPEAMARHHATVKVTRRARAEALMRQHPENIVEMLMNTIQSLDMARIQIENVHSDEGALFFVEEARAKLINLMGIDKEPG